MSTTMPFDITIKDLGSDNQLFIINIEAINAQMKGIMDEKFVKICEGASDSSLAMVKQRLFTFLIRKQGSTMEIGAIAEFFLHLILNNEGFEPQFLYLNLEEGSIKKGFDGYYVFEGDEWLLESKAGSIMTAEISHKKKVKEAYDDLSKKIAGNVPNNPWLNAYNHASHLDVAADANIRSNIKRLSDNFQNRIFPSRSEFNIIPGSTIVLDGEWQEPNKSSIENDIKALIETFEFRKIKILCVTKKSLNLLVNYLTT